MSKAKPVGRWASHLSAAAIDAQGGAGRWLAPAVVCSLSVMLVLGQGAKVASEAAEPKGIPTPIRTRELFNYQVGSLAAAIRDLIQTQGAEYPNGAEYLARLGRLREQAARPLGTTLSDEVPDMPWIELEQLRREALLANPLLRVNQVLVVKRKPKPVEKYPGDRAGWISTATGADIGLPSNHECNSSLVRTGYDNEIAVFSPRQPDAPLRTLYRPADTGYVGEMDLHFDADRLLFTKSDARNWKVYEMRLDGSGMRQVARMPDDVDCYDACYLPNGKIVFGSSAPFQAVPCWHGLRLVSNLYLADEDGSGARRLCYDQDHDLHVALMPSGQLIYSRWDYTGTAHAFLRPLMLMNPDGSGQRAIYGSSSYYPNSLYFPRPLPGKDEQIICVLSGYHGPHRMGQLVILDISRGWYEAQGIIKRISGCGDPINPIVKDQLVDDDWPKFLHPYPLSDKYFLVASLMGSNSTWGIYLADIFDNLVLLREEPGYALLEPIPVRKTPRPPVIPDRVARAAKDSVVYMHDVYAGPGLAGVPRGTIKNLRVVNYHFGYPNLAGPHLIGRGGPWEVMRILGTVPVEGDGSAVFRIPANTPIALQALDAEGKAVQLMRSWYTSMPGEVVSCVGCHEKPSDVPAGRLASAQTRTPSDITPWRGPARGFDFEREVQPVLDKYCVSCHSDIGRAQPDLRPLSAFPDYRGQKPDGNGFGRMHPEMKKATKGFIKYTPAYEALIAYIRRVSIEDDVHVLVPGEYHADTSELIQLLRKGHHGVKLDEEAWDRLVTWIDLNAPCHGTWGDVFPIPGNAHQRRMELDRLTGGSAVDSEIIPALPKQTVEPLVPVALPKCGPVRLAGWPFDSKSALVKQQSLGQTLIKLELGEGVTLNLVRIPSGQFVMGSEYGEQDEQPPAVVRIATPFWIASTEISNEQFRRFDATHDSGYYQKRHASADDVGLTLNDPQQPVVRVSWEQAMAYCRWLTERTGLEFTLPTEAQWEWACRAGSAGPFCHGSLDADFARWANLADQSFAMGNNGIDKQSTGGVEHLVLEGAALSERRFNDQFRVTAPVGSFQPNAWGLFDMHGNAAEWTLSDYRAYPYRDDDGRNDGKAVGRKVVRGGSFFDRPARSHASYRLAYPYWQRVFNVGFRVACNHEAPQQQSRK